MEHHIYRPKQPITIELTFASVSEIRELLAELRIWTPTTGWSEETTSLFEAFEAAIEE